MKIQIIALLMATISIIACQSNSASEAARKAGEISETIKATTPEGSTTSETGVYMKATIDGKEWSAAKMIPDNDPGSSYKRIHGEAGDIMISFQLWKPTTGMKRSFGEDNAADFWTEDGIFGGRKGEVTVTKADDQWVEGTFYFTATSIESNKTHEVTRGSFRVAATKQ